MRLDRFPVGGVGWAYYEKLFAGYDFRKVIRKENEGIEYYVWEYDCKRNYCVPGDTRIFKTKNEAIRFQIRLREFEIYRFRKFLKEEK